DPTSDGFLFRSIDHLHDSLRKLSSSGGLGLCKRRNFVIVGTIPQPPQCVQIVSCLFHDWIATVTETKHQVLMGSIGARDNKTQLAEQPTSDMECGVAGSANGRPPVNFRATDGQSSG